VQWRLTNAQKLIDPDEFQLHFVRRHSGTLAQARPIPSGSADCEGRDLSSCTQVQQACRPRRIRAGGGQLSVDTGWNPWRSAHVGLARSNPQNVKPRPSSREEGEERLPDDAMVNGAPNHRGETPVSERYTDRHDHHHRSALEAACRRAGECRQPRTEGRDDLLLFMPGRYSTARAWRRRERGGNKDDKERTDTQHGEQSPKRS